VKNNAYRHTCPDGGDTSTFADFIPTTMLGPSNSSADHSLCGRFK